MFILDIVYGKTDCNRFLYAKFPLGVRLSFIIIYAKIKVGRARRPTFILEQVTRVELAGNSLGSCRHTARRHLHYYLITDLIIAILRGIVNPFLSLSSIL